MVFGELVTRFDQMMRPGYAAMFDVTDAQRDELARKQIRLVELPPGDRTAQLAVWVASLTGQTPSPTTASDVMKGQAPVEGGVAPAGRIRSGTARPCASSLQRLSATGS